MFYFMSDLSTKAIQIRFIPPSPEFIFYWFICHLVKSGKGAVVISGYVGFKLV